jgi:hypothetical protein
MSTVRTSVADCNQKFALIAQPFIEVEGLPFANVLDAETIRRVFQEEGALFAQEEEDIFSTEIVVWAFLAQCPRDGKGAACSAAVSDIATYPKASLLAGRYQTVPRKQIWSPRRPKRGLPAP